MLLREPRGGGLEAAAPAILEHMNEDHEAGGDRRVLDSGQVLGGAETVRIDHRGAPYK